MATLNTVCAHCGGVNRVDSEKLAAAKTSKCGKCGEPLITDAPQAITEARFDRFIGQSDVPILVDFWAPWCGPCRAIAPILERAAKQLSPAVRIAKLNIDEAQAVAQRLNVSAIPLLAIYVRGKEIARQTGALPEGQLIAWVRRATEAARTP